MRLKEFYDERTSLEHINMVFIHLIRFIDDKHMKGSVTTVVN